MSHRPNRLQGLRWPLVLAGVAVLAAGLVGLRVPLEGLAADASRGDAGRTVVIGLVGRCQGDLIRIGKELDEACADGSAAFDSIRPAFERALKAQVRIAQDLRTAFGLSNEAQGRGGSAPDAADEAAVNPSGFYNSALAGLLALSDRLSQLIEKYRDQIEPVDLERYAEELARGRAMVVNRRGQARAIP